ncbi:MAG: 50S ribosomal protein L10 [Nitrospinota bacterium]|nr:50S ribosomal protein L10 [Nitrospinota bacterium]
MPTPAKEQSVAELNESFKKAKAAVLANYQGIDATAINTLRSHMRDRSLDFKVIKNKLARKAAKDTPFEILDSYFRGPISLVVSYDDSIAPAKALADYAKTGVKKSPEVICGLVEGKSLTPDEVKVLSELPPKVVLVAQMLGVFQGPTTNFVGVFNSLLRKLVGTLDAVREKKASG